MANNNFHKKSEEEDRYRLAPYKIGAPLTIQSANQIQDMGKRLNEGIKNIEISAISPEISESIPTEHFKEMRRLGEMTESNVSVHAPIIDASGFHEKENRWSEQNRINTEQEFSSIIERANLLGKNTPVVIHGANVFGQEWNKEVEEEYKKAVEKEEKGFGELKKAYQKMKYEDLPELERKEVSKEKFLEKKEARIKKMEEELEKEKERIMPRMLTVVNEETGQIQPLEYEKKERFTGEEVWDPYKRLTSLNNTEWDKNKLEVMSHLKQISELEDQKSRVESGIGDYEKLKEEERKKFLHPEEIAMYERGKQKKFMIDKHIEQIDQHVNTAVEDIHDRLKRFRNEDEKIEKFLNSDEYNQVKKQVKELEKGMGTGKISVEQGYRQKADIISNLMAIMPTPKVWKPVNEFTVKKAAETFSNVALKAYKDEGENAPIIAIENAFPNMPLSRAKELKEAINLTRKEFAKKLVKEKKVSKEKAKDIANKLIGATWDVGHINLLRKAGYDEKEILEEAKKIAKEVKHVHLTDNFGLNDTHLPPGMGNVPIKETLKILEEKGDMENVRHIVEAGNFVQHFKQSPYPYTLEELGSPLYKFGDTSYWSEFPEKHFAADYMVGYGDVLPELHFKKLYGGGFSGLPRELGGGGEAPEKGRFATGGEE